MDAVIKTLTRIGLSERQSIVYVALLELGEARMAAIAKRAKLKRPSVYLLIDELDLLGLVSVITKGKKKIYSATHPRRIAELLRSREHEFDELLPFLVAQYGSLSKKPKMQMFEGTGSVLNAYREVFREDAHGHEVLWLGDIGAIQKKFPRLAREYNNLLRNSPRVLVRELTYGEQSKTWVQEQTRKKLKKNYRVKHLDTSDISFGTTDQCIIGDKVILFSLSEEVFMLTIENKEIAKTYRGMFDLLWNRL